MATHFEKPAYEFSSEQRRQCPFVSTSWSDRQGLGKAALWTCLNWPLVLAVQISKLHVGAASIPVAIWCLGVSSLGGALMQGTPHGTEYMMLVYVSLKLALLSERLVEYTVVMS